MTMWWHHSGMTLFLQPLLIHILPLKSVDLAKAKPHRAIVSVFFLQRILGIS